MAKQQASPLRLSPKSIELLQRYLKQILEAHKAQNELRNKMEEIDIAYARYSTEEDKKAGSQQVGIQLDNITIPVVISQVDSYVGHLADIFLSGYPIFPVVSTPANMEEAEMLESIIDTHAILGSYARQFLLAFRDGIKYNFMPIMHAWEEIDTYTMEVDYKTPTKATQLKNSVQKYTKIQRMDPYNTIWDMRKDPSDICYNGEFAGEITLETRIPLKKFINKHSTDGTIYNLSEIGKSQFNQNLCYYTDPPEINELINRSNKRNAGQRFNWDSYLITGDGSKGLNRKTLMAGVYEKARIFCRIVPSEFYIEDVPSKNSPQIWEFILINGMYLMFAQRIYTAYDILPVLIGQPLEDGFGIQTKSIGESQIPMQEAITKLFEIRFNAARRAVSDRAIYDAALIRHEDINKPVPAPKIPVRFSGLAERSLQNAYMSIPFDARGTDGVIHDAAMVFEMSDKLGGANKPSRGEFQKGNKSVQEWQDTMSAGEERRRLPALMTEMQVMMPIKESIKQNIFQYGATGTYQNQNTGDQYKVDADKLEKMRQKVLQFRVADGFTPKAKMASADFIGTLIQNISSNQILAQIMGPMLPKMIAHLARLGGVRGLEQYMPTTQNVPGGQPPTPTGAPSGPGPTANT